jgi:hypothetical protein
MAGSGFVKASLAGVALLALGACASRGTVEDIDQRVGALESRVSAAEAATSAAEIRASELEAAANQCSAVCSEVEVKAERIFQENLTK